MFNKTKIKSVSVLKTEFKNISISLLYSLDTLDIITFSVIDKLVG